MTNRFQRTRPVRFLPFLAVLIPLFLPSESLAFVRQDLSPAVVFVGGNAGMCRNDPINNTDALGLAPTTIEQVTFDLNTGESSATYEPDIDAAYKDYNALGRYSDPYGPWLKAQCEWREAHMAFAAWGATKSVARLPKDLVLLVPNLGRAGWMIVSGEGDQLVAGIKQGAGEWWGRFTSGDPRISGEAAGSAFGEATKVVVLAKVIPKIGRIPSGEQNLAHLTSEAGSAGIAEAKAIIGKHGIFAVPSEAAAEGTAWKVLRTGLSPGKTVESIPIPQAANALFQRPIPIGLYSGWKYVGGVRYAPAGAISTVHGAFTPSSTLIGPAVFIYGPDVLIYGGAMTYGGLRAYSENE